MVKRKRTSRKRRTSRRNMPTARARIADQTVMLIRRWKQHYMDNRGVSEAALLNAGSEAIARMHSLLDEGVPLKTAYEETNDLFRKDPEHVANFADDVAHQFYLLVRDKGFTVEDAVIATSRGLGTMAANRRRKRKRSKR